jgi:broad specificity phosphatase PhoE
LLLIRHAEIEPCHQHTFGGRIDMNLSTRGHKQARTLAEYLRGKKIDAIYASPMKRVQQTLAPFLNNGASTLRSPPSAVACYGGQGATEDGPAQTILPALREVDFGDWTGLSWQAVSERFGFSAYDWLDQLERKGAPNGENGKTFRARVEPCLHEIARRHRGQNVAVFCHGGVIRMMLAILLDVPLPKTNHFEIEYASVTQVALHPHMAEVELLNFAPWRDFVEP